MGVTDQARIDTTRRLLQKYGKTPVRLDNRHERCFFDVPPGTQVNLSPESVELQIIWREAERLVDLAKEYKKRGVAPPEPELEYSSARRWSKTTNQRFMRSLTPEQRALRRRNVQRENRRKGRGNVSSSSASSASASASASSASAASASASSASASPAAAPPAAAFPAAAVFTPAAYPADAYPAVWAPATYTAPAYPAYPAAAHTPATYTLAAFPAADFPAAAYPAPATLSPQIDPGLLPYSEDVPAGAHQDGFYPYWDIPDELPLPY